MNTDCVAEQRYDEFGPQLSIVRPEGRFYETTRAKMGIDSQRILAFIDAWHRETSLLSSLDEMQDTDSYRRIVSAGRPALKWIIDDLEQRPSLLVMAAADITGENPVTPRIRGDVRAMAGAWVGWYQRAKSEML